MRGIESMRARIRSTEKLLSVVKTMKSLAAVNIRQYEQAAESVGDYGKTVEMGLQVVMRHRDDLLVGARLAPRQSMGAVVIGSDVGMCGSLNDQIVAFSLAAIKDYLGLDPQKRPILAVGEKVDAILRDEGLPVQRTFRVPGSVEGITSIVGELLLDIDAWRRDLRLDQVFLFFNQQDSGVSYQPRVFKLLPEDQEWLQKLRQKGWPGPSLPTYTMAWDPLFSALIRQYIFISLFRSLAHSLASENASRLAAMQRAEKNIEEKLEVLNGEFHHQRQTAITEELLDIISGFEALENG
ncbi:MAG: F0F1 ATP synthase subunit gamma [Pseudomonadota bacterium]|nr:F0F1 ATP synthase subunit gamma [Pseudomonadota bacterium]